MTDLFDEEGFSLTDINETLIGEEAIQQQNDVYFMDSDDDTGGKNKKQPDDEVGGVDKAELSLEEEVDLQRARVSTVKPLAKVKVHMMNSISVLKIVIEHGLADYSILK